MFFHSDRFHLCFLSIRRSLLGSPSRGFPERRGLSSITVLAAPSSALRAILCIRFLRYATIRPDPVLDPIASGIRRKTELGAGAASRCHPEEVCPRVLTRANDEGSAFRFCGSPIPRV